MTNPFSFSSPKVKLALATALLAVLALAAFAVLREAPKANPQGDARRSAAGQGFVYDSQHVAFRMPQGWNLINKDVIDRAKITGGIQSPDAESFALVTVTNQATPISQMERTLDRRFGQLKGFKRISSGRASIAGQDGWLYVYRYQEGATNVRHAVHAVTAKNQSYYLTFTADDDRYDTLQPAWTQILQSYKIK